jgi:transcriptional regulator with XRE-family HTH domain
MSRCTELEETVAPFEAVRKQIASVLTRDKRGWLRTVRQMEAVPLREIAGRLGVLKREVLRLEAAEESGRITLGRLREVASALDCEVVYTFLPKETTFVELAQRVQTAKKEARQTRIEKRKRKEIEKRYKRYGNVSALTILALEVRRQLRRTVVRNQ